MQIIVAALAAGVATFLVVVLVINTEDPRPEPFLTYVAPGFAVMAFAGWLIVPGILANQARLAMAEDRVPPSAGQTDARPEVGAVRQLASVFQTRLIVASALLEGAAFFSLVAYMIERHIACLVIAVFLLIVIACQIPTRNRLETWVSHELENIDQMRMRSPKSPS